MSCGCSLLTSLDGLSGGEPRAGDDGGFDAPGDDATTSPDARAGDSASADARTEGDAAGSSRYASAVLGDNPLLYYRFGEPAGIPAKDEVTGTSIPYPVQGITQGAAGGLLGDTNTAIALDGSGKLALTQSADFAGIVPFSVEAWISRSPTTSAISFVVDHESWSAGRIGWLFSAPPSGFGFERWGVVGGGAVNNSAGAAEPTVAGEWHHVVGTFDGSASRVYVDGVRRGVYNAALPLESIGGSFAVGAQNCNCSDTGFAGILDELAIYPHALTEARILAHFNAGKNQ